MMDAESSVRFEFADDLDDGKAGADAVLRAHAPDFAHKKAFVDPPDRIDRGLGQPRIISYGEADRIADTLCRQFRTCGLGEGDAIAVQAPNTVEAPLLLLGAWRAGLVPCLLPLHWRFDEIHTAFSQIRPKAAVCVGRYGDDCPAVTLSEAAARHISIRFVFAFGNELPEGTTPLDDWLKVPDGQDEKAADGPLAPPDISGRSAIITWAVRKQGVFPVQRTHGELMALAHLFATRLQLKQSDVVLNTYPFTGIAAVAGQLVAPLLAGSEVVLHLPFNFDVFVDQLEQHGITYTAVPAPVITALEERREWRSGTLSLNRLGCVWPSPHGVKSSPDLFESSVPIFDIHNFGELALMVRRRSSGQDPSLLPLGRIDASGGDEASGEAAFETRVRGSVTNEENRQQLKGMLFVRGSTVPSMPCPVQSSEDRPDLQPDDHGFLDTGICCIVDDTIPGHFRCQKSEDVIYHGGAMVAATELDRIYGEFSEFLDAAAFVLEDEVIGERIFAAVVPKPELSPSLVRLKRFLAEKRVAPYKVPDQLVIVKSIPRNGDGTVLRNQILSQI